jgi:PAS domain S-box-containing protein
VQAGRDGVGRGFSSLSPRRQQVLLLAAQGYSDREIGERLGLSASTVQMHRQRAQTLLKVDSRDDLVRWAQQTGLLPGPQAPPGRDDIQAVLGDLEASASQHRRSLSVAASALPILVADERLRLRDASEAACRLLGYERADLLRLGAATLVADHEPAADLYAAYLAQGEQNGRLSLRRQDGSLINAGYHAHVLHPDGEPLYVFVFLPDP